MQPPKAFKYPDRITECPFCGATKDLNDIGPAIKEFKGREVFVNKKGKKYRQTHRDCVVCQVKF